jgi:Leucine-rich repeat (LRR) protein
MVKTKIIPGVKKHALSFALIFISVIAAFALTEWSSHQGEKVSQAKILTEIKNGIASDLKDFEANLKMHKLSENGVHTLRNWANNKPLNQDSLTLYYYVVFRNYSPIINKTGYESLKGANLKTITNDSLRFQIIRLYDYHYNIIEQLENVNVEMQDFKTYFAPVNKILTPYMVFDEKGNLTNLKRASLTENQKSEFLSYLWRMELTKKFKIVRIEEVIVEINKLHDSITNELKT